MSADYDIRFLRDTPWFRELDDAILADLVAEATSRTLGAGDILFQTGQAYKGSVYILRKGELELRRAAGRTERPVPGYVLGLSSYLADTPYPATAVAITDCELLVISGQALWALERKHPALFDSLNRLIARRLQERSVSQAPVAGVLMQPVMAVMGTPLTTCPAKATLKEAFDLMQSRQMGSVPVLDEQKKLLGLATFPSLTAKLIKGGIDPQKEPVRNACRSAQTVSATTPLWRAEEILERERVKHLVVMENDAPVGMLSQTDILHALSSRLGTLRATINATDYLGELRELYRRIGDTAAEALEANRRARTAVRILSEVHLAIQRRCLELTMRKMEEEGWGPPPIPYAFIIMGSGGRKEMMLNPDQDNGIILDEVPQGEEKKVAAWFETFCNRANANLDRVGYILCQGDVMARNPAYHKPLSAWKAQISRMVDRPNVKAARWSNIVFDFRTLYGEEHLTLELRNHIHKELAVNPRLLQYMVQDDAEGRPPLNLFNQLITKGADEKVDVKRNGLRIVADAARILALRSGIGNCNTNDRINALVRSGVLTSDFAATVTAAYDELLDILLTHQIEQYRAGETPDKLVAIKTLRPPLREALRVGMRAVKRFQDRLQDEIGAVMLPF